MKTDILVIGAGIAGASAAARLAAEADVVLIEAESQPGYHTTGRSAAFYAESYGGPAFRPLTAASGDFFRAPPPEVSDRPLVGPRGCIHVFAEADRAKAEATASGMAGSIAGIRLMSRDEALERVPVLRPESAGGAIDDPDCLDIDVAALHQGLIRWMKRRGGRLICDAALGGLTRIARGWRAQTAQGEIESRIVVNAAGAWADEVAGMAGLAPLGIAPKRRTVITFDPSGTAVDPCWPLVFSINEDFYFKPESGGILASPADEIDSAPCDAQPEDYDIALTVDRIERATTLTAPRIKSRWAGLRSFAPDRAPVFGPDPRAQGFVWCAGQGGFGIQSAPAAGEAVAALALGRRMPDHLAAAGARGSAYSPARFLKESVG